MSDGFFPANFIPTALIFGLPILFVVWLVVTYNRLVNLRNTIEESWSDVDTELRRRYDLIPNLVETVKGYAAHEREVFTAVTEARAKAMSLSENVRVQSQDENQLIHSLRQLLAVSEGYPDLKADRNFLQLQEELVNTEDRIQAARRFYNGNVREYNNLVQGFPSGLIAGLFAFNSRDFFEIEDLSARAAIPVTFSQGA
jgi:LemA protein